MTLYSHFNDDVICVTLVSSSILFDLRSSMKTKKSFWMPSLSRSTWNMVEAFWSDGRTWRGWTASAISDMYVNVIKVNGSINLYPASKIRYRVHAGRLYESPRRIQLIFLVVVRRRLFIIFEQETSLSFSIHSI